MGTEDVSGKWLLGEAPDEWVRWMLTDPTLKVEEFLTAEFRHVLLSQRVSGVGDPP